MVDRLKDYNKLLSDYTSGKAKLQKSQSPIPVLRLLLFLGMAVFIYFFLSSQSIWSIAVAIILLLIFITVSIYDNKLKKAIKRLTVLIEINEKEIKALGGDYSMFDAGSEFVDPSHEYSHDLDIFGIGSMFQYINRTATVFGKLQLANYFINAFGFSKSMEHRQKAVHELANFNGFREQLQLIFHNESSKETDKKELQNWLENDNLLHNSKLMRLLAFGLPTVTLSLLILSFFGIASFPAYLIVLQLIIVFLYARQTLDVQNSITSKSKILNKYAQGFSLVENSQFKSDLLLALQSKLKPKNDLSASLSIFKLSTLLKYMDSNLNLLVSVLLNGLFMFNLHLLLKVEKWRKSNKHQVLDWFDSIAEIDALSSLANMAYNNPEFTYPTMFDNEFMLVANELGHPLIQQTQRVVNNLEIQGWNQFAIITGANMSGKSTFLRTIGINFVLAMAGAPVCASQFIFHPIPLHSSVRTSDSLAKNESYFYAELKRLKQIIDELKQGKKKLILLDEILKGTNSKDKQAGSIALIEQLLHFQSVGFFATHDLSLGELQSRFPKQVRNWCFEIEIINDKMFIDYKLHQGVCHNLNATYLMKNMGILMK